MIRILVTGSGSAAATGFIHCLQKTDDRFFFVGTEANPMSSFLSSTDKTYMVPSYESEEYIPTLERIIKKEHIDFVWAPDQGAVQVLSKHRDKLSASLFMPDKEIITLCFDKYATLGALEDRGIPVPKTILLKAESDLKKAFASFGKQIWLREMSGWAGKGAFLASNLEEAQFWLKFSHGWGHFTASEYLPGKGYGCDMLFHKGKLIYLQLKERLAYALAKASIVGVTGTTAILLTDDNPEISKLCEATVRSIDPSPHGAYAVDLKCDVEGNPRVTEINCGRFLSSSIMLFYMTDFNAPYYTVKLGVEGKLPVRIKQYNPVKSGMIISRQLDGEPVIFSASALDGIKKRQLNLKSFLLV